MRYRPYFPAGVVLAAVLSGCPVTDDYYLLPSEAPSHQGGQSSSGGSLGQSGGGVEQQGGEAPQAGRGGTFDGGTSSGGGASSGGVSGGSGGGGAGFQPCMPTTERCNGHDDDCDFVVDEFACPSNCSGFVLPGDPAHGYMFCTGARKANWDTAKKSCEDQDMRLAWLASSTENQAVAFRLDALGSDIEILIGATDQGNEGDWLWVGGEQFWKGDENGAAVGGRFNAWATGTPNNNNNEDCALINAMTGAWSDRPCGATYPYVCEQPD